MSCPRPPRCNHCMDTGIAGEWDAMAGHYWAFCSCPAGKREEWTQNLQQTLEQHSEMVLHDVGHIVPNDDQPNS